MLSPRCQSPPCTSVTVSRRHGWNVPESSGYSSGARKSEWFSHESRRSPGSASADRRTPVTAMMAYVAERTRVARRDGARARPPTLGLHLRGRRGLLLIPQALGADHARPPPASGTRGRSCAGTAGRARSSDDPDAGSRSSRDCGGTRPWSRAGGRARPRRCRSTRARPARSGDRRRPWAPRRSCRRRPWRRRRPPRRRSCACPAATPDRGRPGRAP